MLKIKWKKRKKFLKGRNTLYQVDNRKEPGKLQYSINLRF